MAQRELAEFQAQHPEMSVFYTPDPEDLAEQMPLEMQAGNAPDVFQGMLRILPGLGAEGVRPRSSPLRGGGPRPVHSL